MFAVIHRTPGASTRAPLWDVAGRPLVARQLQWLRAVGVDRVAVEIPCGADGDALAAFLASDAEGARVVQIPSAAPLEPARLAAQAGFTGAAWLVCLPSDCLFAGDLLRAVARAGDSARVRSSAPLALPAGELELRAHGRAADVSYFGLGWSVRLGGEGDALELGAALLSGDLPHASDFPVHAKARAPGVFVARGALVSPEAVLRAPAFVGPEARVEAGAVVGPRAIVGARAIVAAGARVASAVVREGTLVGEGLVVERCAATPTALVDFDTREAVELGDPLLLAGVRRRTVGVLERLAALAFVLAAVPVSAILGASRPRRLRPAARLVRDLLRCVAGELRLVGVSAEPPGPVPPALAEASARAEPGALRIDRALLDEPGDPQQVARARAWYAHAKSARTDASLLLSSLRQSSSASKPSSRNPSSSKSIGFAA